MESNRREFMRKMGLAGTTVGAVSLAGCGGNTGSGGDGSSGGGGGGGGGSDGGTPGTGEKVVEEGLPEERMMGDVVHLSNTERYYAARYQANRLVDRRHREELGVPAQTEPLEFTVVTERENNGEFDMVTYNWTANNGEPDSVIVERFHSEGTVNYGGFSDEEYDELAMSQRAETDEDARQEQIHQAQEIIGEQRPESQYLYNLNTFMINTERFEEDSIVVGGTGIRNIWHYTQVVPRNDEGSTIVTNNWDPSDQLNPLHANGIGPSRNWTPTRFMHDFLVRPDPELQAAPWAATEWNWDDDSTVTFELEEGMTFHDGEDVTASDVKYTFDLIMETEPPAYLNSVVQVVESVETDGDLTVTFNLQEPYVPFILITAGTTPILPEHYWTELIDQSGAENPWQINISNEQPIVGSGPFQWGTWDQGSRFEMPAFEDHAFAAPNIEMRIQRPLSTRDAERQAMINGDYDQLDYWFGDLQQLKDTAGQHDHLTHIESLGTGRQATWVNCQRPPYDDVAMRQATNALTVGAQETIINELYDGFGQEAISPINPSMSFWHNEEMTSFDGVDTAIEILKDAGYVWDGDGNIYYPEGKTGK
ncbi:MAG: ABC transporter substrate-binding protein [Haloarculaceae archaeon]